MRLFDVFKKKVAAPESAPAVPEPIETAEGDDVACAPVTGKAMPMSEVPDPVFSGEVLGAGCAFVPEDDFVYAPVSGTVTVVMGHAVGIKSTSGIEVLVHCGIDTVNLQGRGFTGFVAQGDEVKAGQPILKMDRKVIDEEGYQDCVVLAVSNTADFQAVTMAVEGGAIVSAGDAVLMVTCK